MENEKLICPICGEPTRVYMGNARKDRLCGKHADMLKAGENSSYQQTKEKKHTSQKTHQTLRASFAASRQTESIFAMSVTRDTKIKSFCLKYTNVNFQQVNP